MRDEETPELCATLLERFEGRDADEQEDDVFTLDKPVEEDNEDEED